MGRKDKSKKGKGAEKTSLKTQKKLDKKLKKIEHGSGEQTIEELLDGFSKEQMKFTEVTIRASDPPSPRSHFTITASPDSSELFLFGGEYFDGKKTTMFSDLHVYDQKSKSWFHVTSPNSPPPRSGHQAVYVRLTNFPSSVWIFGGEFVSPTQSRFYHYKDLWCLRTRTRKWEQIKCQGSIAPCARSGHRMFFWKSCILLFGGFNDSGRRTLYFNDLWQFDLVTSYWSQIKFSGDAPNPRSACMLFPSASQTYFYVFAGYQKEIVSKNLEKGRVCADFYRIQIEKDTNKATCVSLRPTGVRPQPPRSSMAAVLHTSNRVLLFGGVHDVEVDDGETVVGHFHNDLYYLDLDKVKWYPFQYSAATSNAARTECGQPTEVVAPASTSTTAQLSDGVFTLRLDGRGAGAAGTSDKSRSIVGPRVPSPRSCSGLALLGSLLYIYGGVFESGDRKVTLDDFYCLDLANPVSWQCLYPGTQDSQEWYGSDLEDDDDEEVHSAEGNSHADSSMELGSGESSDETGDSDDEEIVEDAPVPEGSETYSVYWDRTRSFWYQLMARGLDRNDPDAVALSAGGQPSPAVHSLAQQFARNIFEKNAQPSS